MKKSVKFSLMLAAISVAATSWGAATTFGSTSSTGVQTQAVSSATETTLSEDVTLKLSKGVLGAYDLSIGGGALGVATGTIVGKGFIYPNGTSPTQSKLAPIPTAVTSIDATAVGNAATAAAS